MTESAPWGTDRLYTDHVFNTDPEYCEDYGHELLTGAVNSDTAYKALEPKGRAFLKAAEYTPPPEEPSDDFPLLLTTGRTVYHFHTRTKTGRAPELQDAAPEPWVELAPSDAAALDVDDAHRAAVVAVLRDTDAPPDLVEAVENARDRQPADAVRYFGEELPTGLKWYENS